jgi:hypothetical protein
MTGAKRLLILDGHSSYQTADYDIFWKENTNISLCMLPHTSYLLQPLDMGIFSPLTQVYRKLVEGMTVAGNNHINKISIRPFMNNETSIPRIRSRAVARPVYLSPTTIILYALVLKVTYEIIQNSIRAAVV